MSLSRFRVVVPLAHLVVLVCLAGSIAAADPAHSLVRKDSGGLLVHTINSEYQPGELTIRVLLPKRLEEGRRYPVLYVLPVEAGDGTRWGNGMAEVQKHGLADRFGLICVAPTFAQLPWYADHPTDPNVRQESHFLNAVVPLIDREYPTQSAPEGRWLLGFSKSGWGAFSMLLRHPNLLGKAVAWDAPLMMDRPGLYGSGPIFGSPENFAEYEIAGLLRRNAAQLGEEIRLMHFGYGNFREHHEAARRLMDELGIRHVYRDGPKREHSWHSGWVPEAVELLTSDNRLDSSRGDLEN